MIGLRNGINKFRAISRRIESLEPSDNQANQDGAKGFVLNFGYQQGLVTLVACHEQGLDLNQRCHDLLNLHITQQNRLVSVHYSRKQMCEPQHLVNGVMHYITEVVLVFHFNQLLVGVVSQLEHLLETLSSSLEEEVLDSVQDP